MRRQKMKRLLLGRPLAGHEEQHQRLGKAVALPVFASDAISSTAYATDEILVVLLGVAGMGAGAWKILTPLALVVCGLLGIVVISYRQTIHAYPSGGGSYIVSRQNLGTIPALVAGASLLVDYILTVAVSVAAGVLAITSAVPSLSGHRVLLCLGMIGLMTLANLRGLRESAMLFAPPTYIYITMLILLIVVGLFRIYVQGWGPIDVQASVAQGIVSPEASELAAGTKALGLMLLLRAFASGAVALSGVEAVSNGVPAFRKPEPRNAAITIAVMGTILGSCFLGVSIVAAHLRPYRGELDPTGLALMARYVYGGPGILFWITQIATFAILILAANTAYADFPRLASIIGADSFLPRQFAHRGNRLVFSNGVLFLAAMACVLIVIFGGNVSALIPLYAFGVFTGFTLSQAGMVRHHLREREPNWQRSLVINATGALTTGIVALVVVVSKFTQGAWLPAVIIPMLVLLFLSINKHYTRVAERLRIKPDEPEAEPVNTMIVLVGGLHRGVLYTLRWAKHLGPDQLVALYVAADEDQATDMRERWCRQGIDVPLEVEIDPYRELSNTIVNYVDHLSRDESHTVAVVIPEFVVKKWWEHLLHNQTALFLKGRLLFRENVAVISVPYHL
ncbi:MAG: APC family permease [Acidimicrobiales bacterium]